MLNNGRLNEKRPQAPVDPLAGGRGVHSVQALHHFDVTFRERLKLSLVNWAGTRFQA